DPIGPRHLSLLKYFVKHPLSTISNVARELGCHPETVSKRLSYLKNNYWMRIQATSNRWAFGLRSFLLFFDLTQEMTAAKFFESVTNYPFFHTFYEDRINHHHYLSFLFPSDSDIVDEFIQSMKKLAKLTFRYWNLQEGVAYGFSNNMDLLTERGWSLPNNLLEQTDSPMLSKEFQPTIRMCEFDDSLSPTDLVLSGYLSHNCRMTSKYLSNALHSIGISISPSSAYHRRRKLLTKGIVVPLTMWFDRKDSAHLRFEVTGSLRVRNEILASALRMPEVAYYITSESLILWLSIPIEHVKEYVQFCEIKSKSERVKHKRLVIGKAWSGSGPLIDIVKDWKFGSNGYTVEGLDINPNLTDYILF
ncbi:MAG: hypothetical protein ACFFEE_10990, partial [Candidatus Thorarchaeota archaeon]